MDFTKDEPGDDGGAGGAGVSGELVRQQSWPCPGAAELELTIDVGRIRVDLAPSGDTDEVRVEVRHDAAAGNAWTHGLGGLLNWLGGATGNPGFGTGFGGSGFGGGGFADRGLGDRGFGGGVGAGGPGFGGFGADPAQLAAEAVRAVEITWSEGGRRLVVRSATELPLRGVPLVVTIAAPDGSRLAARAGSGDVTVTGTAGWAAVRTGSGRVSTDAVDGDADVNTGSGDVDLGPISGRGRVRTGSGTIRVAAVHGPTEVRASSGDITVQGVHADLGVRTGSGEVTVADASAGRLDLTTGSGDLRVGVHVGVHAELDLSSGSGRAHSDLEVRLVAPEQGTTLLVRGRTGSGDVLVTRA